MNRDAGDRGNTASSAASSRVSARLLVVSRCAGFTAVTFAAIVVVGWATTTIELVRWLPNAEVATAPLTAVAVGLAGCSLSLLQRFVSSDAWQWVGRALGLVVGAVGAVVVAEHLLGASWSTGSLLFADQVLDLDGRTGGRPAATTAASLICIGAALALLDHNDPKRETPAQLLAVAGGVVALVGILGYAYGAGGSAPLGGQAFPTSVSLLVLSIGVLSGRPTIGMIGVLSSAAAGGILVRRMLWVVVLAPLLLSALALQAVQTELLTLPLAVLLLAVTNAVVLTGVVLATARSLNRVDIERSGLEDDALARERDLAKVTHLALHDDLTGLANRALFFDRLELAFTRRGSLSLAVLFLDLDRFKVVNDSLGHAAGDRLLVDVARALSSVIRPSDTAARLGGDEFAIICDELDNPGEAVEIAQRIGAAVASPIDLGGEAVVTTASIGVAYAEHANTAGDLLRHADVALYRAKEGGRARVELFADHLGQQAGERLAVEQDLRRAIDGDELCLYYQPIVDLKTGRVTSLEALLRWQHPNRGLLTPEHFLDVAEETGLIVPIGAWVLAEASRQAVAWQDVAPAIRVFVNLSARELVAPDLPRICTDSIAASGCTGDRLGVEVTEGRLMSDPGQATRNLTALVAAGFEVAIDDFGTGYSSLAYLRQFPVQVLKIDRSLVADLDVDDRVSSLVNAVVRMGEALGLRVVAEGVETAGQLQELRILGCHATQGYLLARPGPPAVIEPMLALESLAPVLAPS